MSTWCNSLGELDDFIGFVLLSGSNNYPAWRNMDMKKAFSEINASLDHCAKQIGSEQKLLVLKKLASDAEAAYAKNDVARGAHLLQDIAEEIRMQRWWRR